MDASRRRSPRRAARRRALPAAVLAAGLCLAACADFSTTAPPFSAQPSLSPAMIAPQVPDRPPATSTAPAASSSTSPGSSPSPGSSSPPNSTGASGSSAAPTTGTTAPADPCLPADPAVVAACLSAPWGLAPLPDGVSALVGERTTGRILRVAAGTEPVLVTTVAGIDATGDGGLLGVAVSPSYTEDGLIYAYVTTATDNRVIRIAAGDKPKAILTGIPKGAKHNGGAIAFVADGTLYVGTGDTGRVPTGSSLAGKLLRLDQFGKPAAGNPSRTSPIYASGFTQVTGLCLLPTGVMAAVDHRAAADVLLPARSGQDYTTLKSGDATWTWDAGDGGAADCATSGGLLTNTSLAKQQLTGIAMSAGGTFSGSPRVLLDRKYGRLLTVEPGSRNALWLTTSNKDGQGKPVSSDDRVILLLNAGGSGGDGPD